MGGDLVQPAPGLSLGVFSIALGSGSPRKQGNAATINLLRLQHCSCSQGQFHRVGLGACVWWRQIRSLPSEAFFIETHMGPLGIWHRMGNAHNEPLLAPAALTLLRVVPPPGRAAGARPALAVWSGSPVRSGDEGERHRLMRVPTGLHEKKASVIATWPVSPAGLGAEGGHTHTPPNPSSPQMHAHPSL